MPTYPIAAIQAESFGPFGSIDIQLSPQLNVVVGDNGTGKSQLLKLLYSCASVLGGSVGGRTAELTKGALSSAVADKLVGVFRPEQLGRLANRAQGRARSEVSVKFSGLADPLSFNFASNSSREVRIEKYPAKPLSDDPVYLPTRELLSIYPGFVSLYNTRELEFEETWRDTAELLGRPSLRGPRAKRAGELLQPLADVLEGTVFEDRGRFYVKQKGIGNIEASLMAEGQRKLAMIVRLVTSGVLLDGGYLFWDEPEANLNPKTQRAVARVIAVLAEHGSQVTIATHSLYLLRELQMQVEGDMRTRYIGLSRVESRVGAESVPDLDDLQSISALEAELEQNRRYLFA